MNGNTCGEGKISPVVRGVGMAKRKVNIQVVATVTGKVISLVCSRVQGAAEIKEAVNEVVRTSTGDAPDALILDGWYDSTIVERILETVRQGKNPLIAQTNVRLIGVGSANAVRFTSRIGGDLTSPIRILEHEAEMFLKNHKGRDVVPRKFITKEEGLVVVEAPSPGYDCTLLEGVYEGILTICQAEKGSITQIKCLKKGDATCVYRIKWDARQS